VHDTLYRKLFALVPASGVGRIDHCVPFHISASVWLIGEFPPPE
jgi:hypothetical protein